MNWIKAIQVGLISAIATTSSAKEVKLTGQDLSSFWEIKSNISTVLLDQHTNAISGAYYHVVTEQGIEKQVGGTWTAYFENGHSRGFEVISLLKDSTIYLKITNEDDSVLRFVHPISKVDQLFDFKQLYLEDPLIDDKGRIILFARYKTEGWKSRNPNDLLEYIALNLKTIASSANKTVDTTSANAAVVSP